MEKNGTMNLVIGTWVEKRKRKSPQKIYLMEHNE